MNLNVFELNAPQTVDVSIVNGLKEALFVAYNVSNVVEYESECYHLQEVRSNAHKLLAQYNAYPTSDISAVDAAISTYCCNLNLLLNNSKFLKDFGEVKFSWIDPFTSAVFNSSQLSIEISNFMFCMVVINMNSALKPMLFGTEHDKASITERLYKAHSIVSYMLEKKFVNEDSYHINPLFLNTLQLIISMVCQHRTIEVLGSDFKNNNTRNESTKLLPQYCYEAINTCKKLKENLSKLNTILPKMPIEPEWLNLCDISIPYFNALAMVYIAKSMNAMESSAMMVACLKQAIIYINTSITLAQKRKSSDLQFLKSFLAKIESYHKEVNFDNTHVYFREVPKTLDGLTIPPAVSCFTPKRFSFLQSEQMSYTDCNIFNKLYSKTTSIKADASPYRMMLENIRDNAKTQVYKSDNELEIALEGISSNISNELQSLSGPSIKRIQEEIDNLRSNYATLPAIEASLKAHRKLVDQNSKNFQELLNEFYLKINNVNPSIKDNLIKKKNTIESALSQSEPIDKSLGLMLQKGRNQFETLLDPSHDIADLIPTLKSANSSNVGENNFRLFQTIMGKVSQMKEQRTRFLNDLIKMIDEDDVTLKLSLLDKEMHSGYFKQELKKFEQPVNYLKQNIAAQPNIIKAVKEAHNNCKSYIHELESVRDQQEEKVAQIFKTCEIYKNFYKEIRDGSALHKKIESLIQSLKTELSKVQSYSPPPTNNYDYYQQPNTAPHQYQYPIQHQQQQAPPNYYQPQVPSRSLKPKTDSNASLPPNYQKPYQPGPRDGSFGRF